MWCEVVPRTAMSSARVKLKISLQQGHVVSCAIFLRLMSVPVNVFFYSAFEASLAYFGAHALSEETNQCDAPCGWGFVCVDGTAVCSLRKRFMRFSSIGVDNFIRILFLPLNGLQQAAEMEMEIGSPFGNLSAARCACMWHAIYSKQYLLRAL